MSRNISDAYLIPRKWMLEDGKRGVEGASETTLQNHQNVPPQPYKQISVAKRDL